MINMHSFNFLRLISIYLFTFKAYWVVIGHIKAKMKHFRSQFWTKEPKDSFYTYYMFNMNSFNFLTLIPIYLCKFKACLVVIGHIRLKWGFFAPKYEIKNLRTHFKHIKCFIWLVLTLQDLIQSIYAHSWLLWPL